MFLAQDAVSLLDDVLSRLVARVGVPVVLIAENHDSPERHKAGYDIHRRRIRES